MPNIFGHIGVETFAKIFNCDVNGRLVYELMFDKSVKDMRPEICKIFADLLKTLSECSIDSNILDICLVLVEIMSKVKIGMSFVTMNFDV